MLVVELTAELGTKGMWDLINQSLVKSKSKNVYIGLGVSDLSMEIDFDDDNDIDAEEAAKQMSQDVST